MSMGWRMFHSCLPFEFFLSCWLFPTFRGHLMSCGLTPMTGVEMERTICIRTGIEQCAWLVYGNSRQTFASDMQVSVIDPVLVIIAVGERPIVCNRSAGAIKYPFMTINERYYFFFLLFFNMRNMHNRLELRSRKSKQISYLDRNPTRHHSRMTTSQKWKNDKNNEAQHLSFIERTRLKVWWRKRSRVMAWVTTWLRCSLVMMLVVVLGSRCSFWYIAS